MLITKERIEHELLKLKDQFPADHVGAKGVLQDPGGNTCIWGQLMLNMFGCATATHEWMYATDQEYQMTARMIELNNFGVPWHQIVDQLVPPTAIDIHDAEAGILPEKSFAKNPKPEVDVVYS